MLSLRHMTKELFTEKTRIILTILAIAWGAFTIATMLSVGEGLRLTFAQTMANSGHNLLIIKSGTTSKDYKGLHANQPIKLKKQDYTAISKLPNVLMSSPIYSDFGSVTYNDVPIPIQAVNDHYNIIHSIPIQNGGRFFSPLDMQKNNAVIVLGDKLAKEIFPKKDNPVGSYIPIKNKPFLVIGIMQPKPQMMGGKSPDTYLSWIPSTTYELYKNPQFINSIYVTIKNEKIVEQTKTAIIQAIAFEHNADPTDTNIVEFHDHARRQSTINNFFLGLQVFLGIVGSLTLLVAGVGIANVMYASISRSTHQIGIRLAIGARTFQILFHYILEALVATFLGGLLGISMSALLVYAIRMIPMHGKLIEHIGKPQPVLSLSVIIIVVLILGLTGFIAGFFPALKASHVDPAEALRYE